MDTSNIFYIFNLRPFKDKVEHSILGKFLLHDGNFELLEDHGLPKGLASMPAGQAAPILHRFTNSMYFQVVNLQDLLNGMHPDFIPSVDAKQEIDDDVLKVLGKKPSKDSNHQDFDYDRVGGEGPRTLSISDGQAFLDGQLLEADEIKRLQEHVKGGKALLRMRKSESIFNPGMEPHLNEDTITGVGNLRAYNTFLSKNYPGIHLHINAHDVRHVNDSYGSHAGTKYIKSIGAAIGHVAKTLIGEHSHVFRLGGDRFVVHVPSADGAALFSRGLRQHLNAIPAMNGTHNFAVSIGAGPTPDHAQWALHDSSAEKNGRKYPPGQSKTHISVRIPGGFQGSIPTE